MTKIALPIREPLQYERKEINITEAQFVRFVTLINNSGYWKLLPIIKCPIQFTDGGGYILEVNTKGKYNYVNVYSCPEQVDPAKELTRACNELVKDTGLEKEILLTWQADIDTVDMAK